MIATKDVESKGKKDDKKRRVKVEFGGGKGGKRQGQRKEKQYDDEERSEQRKWMNMCREIERKIKGNFFYSGAQKRKKRGIKEIVKFKEEREERRKDKKTDRHKKKNV